MKFSKALLYGFLVWIVPFAVSVLDLSAFLSEGVRIGAVWLAISLFIDLLLFMEGPMKMSLLDYVKDIGLTYLIIPTITIGFGYLLGRYES